MTMIRTLLAAVSLALTGAFGSWAQEADKFETGMDALKLAQQQEDWQQAIELGAWLVEDPDFDNQPDEFRAEIHWRYGFALFLNNEDEDAIVQLDLARAAGADRPAITYWQVISYIALDRFSEAANALIGLTDTSAGQFEFSQVDLSMFYRVLRGLEKRGRDELRGELFEAIVRHYEPFLPEPGLDFVRRDYALFLVDRGQTAAALRQFLPVTHPKVRLQLRIDARFSAFWDQPGFDRMTDIRRGAEASLARYRQASERYPRYLEPRSAQLGMLITLGHYEEAEALGRETLAEIEAGRRFLDQDEQIPWLRDRWADSLLLLDRPEEAEAVMIRAAELDDPESDNVNQLINFTGMLISQGRWQEALDLHPLLQNRPVAPFGEMWLRQHEACAFHALGDDRARDRSLAELETNWRDNPFALQKALICTGRIEQAAAHLIRRLNDRDFSGEALAALQRFEPEASEASSKPDPTPGSRWQDAFIALGERDDVKAAVRGAGRVETHDLPGVYLSGY